MLKNYNIWPVSGGYIDQPAKFLKVLDYCDRVKINLDHIQKDYDDAKNQIQNK